MGDDHRRAVKRAAELFVKKRDGGVMQAGRIGRVKVPQLVAALNPDYLEIFKPVLGDRH